MYENENKDTFFARLEPRLAPSDVIVVRGAYYMSKYGHRAQTRKEEDSDGNLLRYFEHPRRVALRMMDTYGVYDVDNLCTGLLHDTLEDTDDIDAPIIEHFYGKEVARRVRILSKKPKEGYIDRLSFSDKWVKFGKLVDREDNLESLPQDEPDFIRKTLKDTYTLLGTLISNDPRYHIGVEPIDPDQHAMCRVVSILNKYADQKYYPDLKYSLYELQRGTLSRRPESTIRNFYGFDSSNLKASS